MEDKKIYTRNEFAILLQNAATEMASDEELKKGALDILVRADHYHWIHQTSWMGEPILNLPQDMFAIQEIIFQTHPSFIIEVGVAWGGAMLFYATLLEAMGEGMVVGIDVFIPQDLRQRLMAHGKVSERITLIQGSSIDITTVQEVKAIVGDSKNGMVILDSNHSHDHVLKELECYSPFVGEGCYLICGDTILEDIPVQEHRSRPWGPGNNPKTALRTFLQNNDCFQVDHELENKLLLTCSPEGYLRRIR